MAGLAEKLGRLHNWLCSRTHKKLHSQQRTRSLGAQNGFDRVLGAPLSPEVRVEEPGELLVARLVERRPLEPKRDLTQISNDLNTFWQTLEDSFSAISRIKSRNQIRVGIRI